MRHFLSFRRISLGLFGGLIVTLATIIGTDRFVSSAADHRHTALLSDVPYHEVALVLGCAEYLRNGRLNLFFQYRVNAAAELYHAGKCDLFIVSGDHGRKEYNEPAAMRRALVNRRVPNEIIVSDFAGFRTLDSVVRAKEVFACEKFIVVSQEFHNERAIFIGQQRGATLTGYNAKDVPTRYTWKTRVREKLARTKTTLDLFVTRTEPKFAGPPETMPKLL